jgi:ribosomal protein L37AE/L43A
MTHAESITAHARWWLKQYTEARNEANAPHYDLAIAQRTHQVLCTHPEVRNLYAQVWECKICGGLSG